MYAIHARDYLWRAEEQIAVARPENFFYAAFELRCCIESRLQQYLKPWEHIPKNKRNEWAIAKLGKSITQYLSLDEQIARLDLHDRSNGKSVGVFYYTPISASAKKNGEILGRYLHAQQSVPSAEWWDSFKQVLDETVSLLKISTKGTLLGPPLRERKTNRMFLNAELPPGKENMTQEFLQGNEHTLTIEYIDILPNPLEENAVTW